MLTGDWPLQQCSFLPSPQLARSRPSCVSIHARSKLSIYLPHKVFEDKGKAKWDSKAHVLSVTLPINRDDVF